MIVHTAHAWIGVLEARYVAARLTPFHRSFGKRLTKTPKLDLLDPGTGDRQPAQATRRNLAG